MIRHPNWLFAEDILARTLPGATSFDVDRISGLTAGSWTEFPIDGRDPTVVTRGLLEYCTPGASGMLVIVTFLSFRLDVGPFFVGAGRLREFASTYPDIYDDAFIAGDVFILSPTTGALIVVHHNGLVATVHGEGAQSS